jgi:sulfotransferase family protein
VFVVGSPRSGTTLLYDMLLSAGNFAVYLTESNVFSLLAQRFGDLKSRDHRQKLIRVWLGSKLFRASGLDPELIERRIAEECTNYGQFLRITMEEIARSQGMRRWAENTPEHLIYLPMIRATLPDALVVHMIRDGRAVALSLDKRTDRGLRTMPWNKDQNLFVQGLYWEWIVRRGRKYGRALGPDYIEVRFEDLILQPRPTLAALSEFLDQQLDYDRIQQVGYGSVSKPNTSFRQEPEAASFDPVSRWRSSFSQSQLEMFEGLVGSYLEELGYPLLTSGKDLRAAQMKRMKKLYSLYFSARFKAKNSRLLRWLRGPITSQELDEIVMGDDQPAKLYSASGRPC